MSRRGKPVAFQFYGQDWLTDPKVRVLSDAARAAYVDLLCYAHAERGIFEDPDKVRAMLGRPRRGWARIWSELEPFWPPCGDARRMNPKLAEVIASQDERRASGSKGGISRAEGCKLNASKPQAKSNPPSPSPSPSPSPPASQMAVAYTEEGEGSRMLLALGIQSPESVALVREWAGSHGTKACANLAAWASKNSVSPAGAVVSAIKQGYAAERAAQQASPNGRSLGASRDVPDADATARMLAKAREEPGG